VTQRFGILIEIQVIRIVVLHSKSSSVRPLLRDVFLLLFLSLDRFGEFVLPR
jgi:hypothetical protein